MVSTFLAKKEGLLAGVASFLAKKEKPAGVASFLAKRPLGLAGSASFLAKGEKPFFAAGAGIGAAFLPNENPPNLAVPDLALFAAIVAFFSSIFFLYSAIGMFGPPPPKALTLVETIVLVALAATTGRAATAEVKEREAMVRKVCGLE